VKLFLNTLLEYYTNAGDQPSLTLLTPCVMCILILIFMFTDLKRVLSSTPPSIDLAAVARTRPKTAAERRLRQPVKHWGKRDKQKNGLDKRIRKIWTDIYCHCRFCRFVSYH
jgi:hypothetical protein